MNDNKKFCCDRFIGYYEQGKIYDGTTFIKEVYPNIRIVKIVPDQLNQGKNLYRYYLVCGLLKDKPPIINMKYCPFCGTHLFDFYQSDEYINETDKTFSI